MKENTRKIKNWKEYNAALINRGKLTIWFDQSIATGWYNNQQTGKKGRSNTYSDLIIECALTVRCLYRFSLRQTQGFLMSFAEQLAIDFTIPNYTTLSRRASKLNVDLLVLRKPGGQLHILIDSTGLKVYGEGEWKMRIHGKDKRRTWRKLHVAINRETHQIEAIHLTKSNVHDSTQTSNLLRQIPEKIQTVTADKAYDNKHGYAPIVQREAKAIIPLRSGAALQTKNIEPHHAERNRLVREKHFCGGLKNWKIMSGYHKRSLVETAMFRIKTMVGADLQSIKFENQQKEAVIMGKLINKMTQLGMPQY